MADASKIKRRHSDLTAAKQLHEQVWKDCYDLSMPARAHGLLSEIITATDAQQRKAVIYDSTAPDSVRVGVATVMGGMVPSNAQWFFLDIGAGETDAEQVFLDEAAKFIWENIHASNFDAEAFDAMLDVWIAGWHVLYCEEPEAGGFYFETWPVGECVIGSSRTGGLVDTVYRSYHYTVSQMVTEFGLDKVSPKVKQLWEVGKYDDKIKLTHAIEPREVYAKEAKLAANMKFGSCHMEVDSNHILREGGYHEFPCMAPRWSRLPNSAYATGPMSDALPDVRTLNEVTKWTLMGAETTLAPPMIAEDDGVLNPKNIKMGPRKIIVANSVDSMKPLITGARVDFGLMTRESLQGTIRKILMADQLPPVEGQSKTAYEWSVRVSMLRQMLGPMFGRFQAEFLQPLVERCFGIAWRANLRSEFRLIGRPPETLLDRNFTVRYLSPLARAQREEEVASLDRFEADLGMTVKNTGKAELLDLYDWEEGKRLKSRMLGVPQKLIRDERKLGQIREQQAQAQQAAQQQALATQGQAEMQGAMAQRMATAA
ncbi:portal protein [Hydrogenophaga sp.]|uniref:portal protein n=1 Tax=Hydrogenophaga sp. TaxID=1904254 RepID=UPI00273119EE|nr:portal protein [Hydrogenophaga sp.]MDP2074627.1 portal protein [Hydrogenophaga sp.]MDP3106404.1 portal protein [Hydrogenophaga sp.]